MGLRQLSPFRPTKPHMKEHFDDDDLKEALKLVQKKIIALSGQRGWLKNEIERRRIRRLKQSDSQRKDLYERIFRMGVDGKTQKAIARELNLSKERVATGLKSFMYKKNVDLLYARPLGVGMLTYARQHKDEFLKP